MTLNFHLFHMKKLGMDYMNIIKTCFEDGLTYAVDIGINPDNFKDRTKTAAGNKGLIYCSRLLPVPMHIG